MVSDIEFKSGSLHVASWEVIGFDSLVVQYLFSSVAYSEGLEVKGRLSGHNFLMYQNKELKKVQERNPIKFKEGIPRLGVYKALDCEVGDVFVEPIMEPQGECDSVIIWIVSDNHLFVSVRTGCTRTVLQRVRKVQRPVLFHVTETAQDLMEQMEQR